MRPARNPAGQGVCLSGCLHDLSVRQEKHHAHYHLLTAHDLCTQNLQAVNVNA